MIFEGEELETFAFGDSPEMADRLLGFVIAGSKRATCWPAASSIPIGPA